MSNSEKLVQLWKQAGMDIDETRLRIFALLSMAEQQKLLDQIKSEIRQPLVV